MKITIHYNNGKEVTQDLSDKQREKFLTLLKIYGEKVPVRSLGSNKISNLSQDADKFLKNPDRQMGLVLNNNKAAANITKIVLSPKEFDEKKVAQQPTADVTCIEKLLRTLPRVLVFDGKTLRLNNANIGKPTKVTTDLYQTTSSKPDKPKSSRQQQPRLSCELMTILFFCSVHPDRQLAIIEDGLKKEKPNKAIKQWQEYIKDCGGINIDYCHPCSKERVQEIKLRGEIFNNHQSFKGMAAGDKQDMFYGNLAGVTLPMLQLFNEINQKNTTPVKLWQCTLIHPIEVTCNGAAKAKPLLAFNDKRDDKKSQKEKEINKIEIADKAIQDFKTFKEPGFSAVVASGMKAKSKWYGSLVETIGIVDCIEDKTFYPEAYKKLPRMVKVAAALYQLAALEKNKPVPDKVKDTLSLASKQLSKEEFNQVLAVLVYRDDEGNSLLDKLSIPDLNAMGVFDKLEQHGEINGFTQLWIRLKMNMTKVTDANGGAANQAICQMIQAAIFNHHWDTGAVKKGRFKFKSGPTINIEPQDKLERKASLGVEETRERRPSFTATNTSKSILDEIQKAVRKADKKKSLLPYTTAVTAIMKMLEKECRSFSEWQDPSKKPRETRSLDSNIMYHQLLEFIEVSKESRAQVLPQQPGDTYNYEAESSSPF